MEGLPPPGPGSTVPYVIQEDLVEGGLHVLEPLRREARLQHALQQLPPCTALLQLHLPVRALPVHRPDQRIPLEEAAAVRARLEGQPEPVGPVLLPQVRYLTFQHDATLGNQGHRVAQLFGGAGTQIAILVGWAES